MSDHRQGRSCTRGLAVIALFAAVAVTAALPATAGAKARDRDHDGLSNRFERNRSHTNPRKKDSDHDGLKDGYEVRRSHTNARKKDTDRDRLSDGFEVKRSHTNPRNQDTDGDGLTDRFELKHSHTSPRKKDTNGNGISDSLELLLGHDPDGQAAPQAAGLVPPFPLDLLPPETTISGGPSGTVTSASAIFSFTSSEDGSSFDCQLDSGSLSDCTSPRSFSGLANGSHTFRVRATDAAGNTDLTPASRTWTVAVPSPDTTAPDTTISGGPSGTVDNASPSFTFASSESGSTFECKLDSGSFADCTSPKAYTGLTDGSHTFKVRATDTAGNTDASPASRTWTVDTTEPDTTPPNTTLSGGPSGTVTSSSASFGFSSSETGSTFECQLDSGAFAACTSPTAYSGLGEGSHTFKVRATDTAGNTDASPASRTWTIDSTAPNTTISGGPSGTVTSDSASFTFTGSESGSTFECQLDSGAFADCTSPKAYSGLADGSHTFKVRATDTAGNTDASPATRTWTVDAAPADTTAPDTSISSGPSGTVSSASASFTFASTESGSTFECQLDSGAFADCSSPKGYSGLANGPHTFNVRATDAADNTDASPASRTWTVDVSSSGGCATSTPNVPDGPDPKGGCFPGPSNTGVPAGTALTAYTGSCTISAPNTVIDSKTVNCSPLNVGSGATGLVIKNSQINGGVIQDGGSATFTIQDSTIDNNVSYPACTAPSSCSAGKYACGDPNNATTQCGVGYRNFTILRTEIMHTNRAAYCEKNCLIQDSYFHGTNLWPDHTNMAHASSTRVEQNTTLTHNSLACDYQGPFDNDDLGCSADISGYPDFAPINHNTITGNLFGANNAGIGFCVYGGGTPGKPYSGDSTNATYVVFQDNVFQRGSNGKCGAYGAVTSFVSGRTGNIWSGNVWDNGATVAAVN